MFELLKTTLTQIIDPYANEARSLVADRTTEGRRYLDRIVGRLDGIREAVLWDEWDSAPKKFDFQFMDADSTKEVTTVPQDTVWVLDVFQAVMIAGGATVIMDVNGRYRGGGTVATSGISSGGVAMMRNLHLVGGDAITIRTVGMGAGEDMRGYIQFRAKTIKSPRLHAGGQPEVMADRQNDQGEDLERHSTPGIFLAPTVRGPGSGRDPHMPPALPRV